MGARAAGGLSGEVDVVATRSRIFIAEAFMDPGGVTYRLASGPGWGSVGGSDVHVHGRARAALDTELTDEVLAAVGIAVLNIGNELVRMADRLELVQPLPLG